MTLTATCFAAGIRLASFQVADVWVSPATIVEVTGGTVSEPLFVAGPWGSPSMEKHLTVLPLVPGGEVVVRATGGPLRIDAHPVIAPWTPAESQPLPVGWPWGAVTVSWGGGADADGDGIAATDNDISAFYACLGGNCCVTCTPDHDGDGDAGVDADLESFWRAMAGASK